MFNWKKITIALAMLSASLAAQAVCPDGMTYDATSRLCADGVDAAGPFTKQMTDLCVKYGAGSSCTSVSNFKVGGISLSLQRWNKSFAKSLRGAATCPVGSVASANYNNYCFETLVGGSNLYGNFNQALVDKCRAFDGGLACLSNRWSPSWYAYVRDAPAPFMWSKAADLNANLPLGIEIYRGSGDGLVAYYAKLNTIKNPNLDWNVEAYLSGGGRTPTQYVASALKKAYVAVNGGFFDHGNAKQSLSLIVQNGSVMTVGATEVARNSRIYYPTRGAFGQDINGVTSAVWPYPVGSSNTLYAYPQASPNDASKPPQPQPSASFPAGARIWQAKKAIGAGPLLIKNGVKVQQEVAELIDSTSGINPDTAGPRTAVAKLADGSIVLMVLDGRSTLSRGVTTTELRDILFKLGATEALNLDGGGSTTMVVNGVVLNHPSDGTQRYMPSVVMFQDK